MICCKERNHDPTIEKPKPVEHKLQPKERVRTMDNLKIEDIWKNSQGKQYEAFLPGNKAKPLNPIAEILLNELKKTAMKFRGKILSIYR